LNVEKRLNEDQKGALLQGIPKYFRRFKPEVVDGVDFKT
jgi:hypothetical protein